MSYLGFIMCQFGKVELNFPEFPFLYDFFKKLRWITKDLEVRNESAAIDISIIFILKSSESQDRPLKLGSALVILFHNHMLCR